MASKIMIGLALAVLAIAAPAAAAGSPGDLDPSFSSDGIKRLPGFSFAGLVRNDPRGGVAVEVDDGRLIRLSRSGRVDKSFAENGVLDPGLLIRSRYGLLAGDFAVGSDGRVVVLGESDGRVLLRAFSADGGAGRELRIERHR